jgi:FMN phosphatase YigB (HAD superfamily)
VPVDMIRAIVFDLDDTLRYLENLENDIITAKEKIKAFKKDIV